MKRLNSKSRHTIFQPPASGLRSPVSNPDGITLLELLSVVFILTAAATISMSVFSGNTDQDRVNATLKTLGEIQKGILGVTSDRVKGEVRFAGYVQDMGSLPALYDVLGTPDDPSDDQPKGLWTSGRPVDKDGDGKADGGDLDGDGIIDLIFYKTYTFGVVIDFVRSGWRGGYIRTPADGGLIDSWGNPLIFEITDGDFIITSLGADGKPGGQEYDRDIVRAVRKKDYTATVSGYLSPHTVFFSESEMDVANVCYGRTCRLQPVTVRIYHAPEVADCRLWKKESSEEGSRTESTERYHLTECMGYQPLETTVDIVETDRTRWLKDDGYFRLENVPVGTERLLLVVQKTDASQDIADMNTGHLKDPGLVGMGYKIAVEPGECWLGRLGNIP